MKVGVSTDVIEKIKKQADEQAKTVGIKEQTLAKQEEIVDKETNVVTKYIPTPNFTDCKSIGSQLPISMVNEAVQVLSKLRTEFDFVEFIKEKLGYNSAVAVCNAFASEQIDALVLAIKQVEAGKAFILGDQAGIGKGRVCAGLMRYAKHAGKIPVFITEKENLFSDMYRDTENIGGLSQGAGSNYESIYPFIMNPFSKDKKGVIKNQNDVEIQTPLSYEAIHEIAKQKKFNPKKLNKEWNFNSVFLTYSVISQTRGKSGDDKRAFLERIAPEAIFIFDESHNASGMKSKLGEWCRKYVMLAHGVMFSSATYAKRPEAFPLYAIKSSMGEASLDLEKLEKAISIGGENVSEYISSVLVKEGQMIRRERSFEGCVVDTIYEDNREEVYRIFDEASSQFRNVYNFIRSVGFRNAVRSAVARKAQSLRLNTVSYESFMESKSSDERKAKFISDNRGKWVAEIDYDTIGATTKFHFKENLFMAVKAKFTADSIIKELRTQVDYKNLDGTSHRTNRKPVIALRATGETMFDKLDLKVGSAFSNDFSEYTKAILENVYRGVVKFKKIDSKLYTPRTVLKEEGIEVDDRTEQYVILNEDFPDGGELIESYLEQSRQYVSGLPLSTIDYLIDRISKEARASWDSAYGYATSPNYVVGEVTGRNRMLRKTEGNENMWELVANDRIKQVQTAFNKYNKGEIDVLIINESGATGGSIQSSVDFIDRRPRIMYVYQTELDVNTEVQKRGRINRTGQVNLPSYIYVVSLIPSEIRMLLALKRKLRKLDANTSANQTQSSSMMAVKNSAGGEAQDIFNKYGEEAFLKEFLKYPENEVYKQLYENSSGEMGFSFSEADTDDEGALNKNQLLPFCRVLEIEPCSIQEYFYDEMNAIYLRVIEQHTNDGTYQMELEVENIKASVKNRSLIAIGSGKSEFSKPLFMEDKYALARKRAYTKEKVERMINQLSVVEGQRPDVAYRKMQEDFVVEYDAYIEGVLNLIVLPVRASFMTDEDYEKAMSIYTERTANKRAELTADKNFLYSMITAFYPNKNVYIPEYTVNDVGDVTSTDFRRGKFLGYKLYSTSQYNRFSAGSIEFVFACLEGNPTLRLKATTDKRLLQNIKTESNYLSQKGGLADNEFISKWAVDPHKREELRFLSGNILSGIGYANKMKENGEIKRWFLVKHTNHDGTISTGLMLKREGGLPFTSLNDAPSRTILVGLDNPEIVDYIKDTPEDATDPYMFYIGVGNIVMTKKDDNQLYLAVFQIKKRGKDSPEISSSSEWNNEIYFDDGLESFKDFHVGDKVHTKDNPYKVTRLGKVQRAKAKKDKEKDTEKKPEMGQGYIMPTQTASVVFELQGWSKIYKFNLNTQVGEAGLKRMFSYINSFAPVSTEFPQDMNSFYNISEMTDLYEPKKGKKNEAEEVFNEGSYEYLLLAPKKTIPYLKEFYEQKGQYGTAILSRPLKPAEAFALKIYPKGFSNSDTVKLLLSVFDEQDRIAFLNNLKEISKKSDVEIGRFVSNEAQKRSVPDLKYIFGDRNVRNIGEILKAYVTTGDIDKIQIEVAIEKDSVKAPRIKTTITPEDAEKILIYMMA